jgi:hypothetical protein
MTKENEYYTGRLKVHKSLVTSLDPELGTKILTYYKTWFAYSNLCDLLCQSRARREISLSTRTLMVALRETTVGHRTQQGMLGPDYWNVDTSLPFGAVFRPPTITRCSPAMPSCTSSWYNITSKLYLVPHRDSVQKVGVLPTFRESSPSCKLLQAQQSTKMDEHMLMAWPQNLPPSV